MKIAGTAVVALSGGLGSTIALFWAKEKFIRVDAFTVDLGSPRALAAAKRVAEFAGVASLRIYPAPPVGLTFDVTSPVRMAFVAALAADYALSEGARDVVLGAVADPRHASMAVSLNAALRSASGVQDFRLWSPLVDLTTGEALAVAQGLSGCWSALAWSHTGGDDAYPPVGPGLALERRALGFEAIGAPDPLIERVWRDGHMILPATRNYDALRIANRIQDKA